MTDLFEVWVYLAEQPLLWLTVTVISYVLAHALFRYAGEFALLNPVLVAVTLLVALLLLTETTYSQYFAGAQFVHFLLGPATVALAVPLYAQAHQLRRLWLPLGIALTAGALTAIVSAFLLGVGLGLEHEMVMSLLSKSATTPVAMGVAERVGGIPPLTAVFVILTGITGAIAGLPLLKLIGERDAGTKGFAMGVASHGIATATAFQHSDRAGAYAGLGMGLNAALTAILVPALLWILTFF